MRKGGDYSLHAPHVVGRADVEEREDAVEGKGGREEGLLLVTREQGLVVTPAGDGNLPMIG